jgi:hypothetical protein
MNTTPKLRKAIKAELRARKWSIGELVRRSGAPKSTVHTFLRGDGDVYYSTAMQLLKAIQQ